jgi:hypothetical protein
MVNCRCGVDGQRRHDDCLAKPNCGGNALARCNLTHGKCMEDRMSIRATILLQIEKVAAEQNKTLAPLTDDLALLESGMDSLCFAILVTRLEDVTGSDPFTGEGDIKFPDTVGELVALHEHAAA